MVTILTTINYYLEIENHISSIERLNELVAITTDKTVNSSDKIIKVEKGNITLSLDWYDTEPPYLFPIIPFTQNNLLSFVFYKLGNHQKSFEFVSEFDDLYKHLLIATSIQFGNTITEEQIFFLQERSQHNLAITYNFGNTIHVDKQTIQNTYKKAINNTDTSSLKLFSIKHYVNHLLDNNLYEDAERLIRSGSLIASSKEEINAMNHLLASALMAQIQLPYETVKLSEIAHLQQKSITYYENNNLKTLAGLLLIEASEIANFQEDFVHAKDLINKSILYFREMEISEFLGEAILQKANLLYNWSKNGSPQYYKQSINTFQNALKIFKRDSHPQKFAEIHHNLALIYSEIQVSEKEKPIWTAFCASSFKEALQFYIKEKFPYQNAMISHNYATALMGFPEAKLNNNLNKAFELFEEALTIRTAQNYPFERALTLLNQLELYWLRNNKNKEDEIENFEAMVDKANEISRLISEKELTNKAKEHLKALENLKPVIE